MKCPCALPFLALFFLAAPASAHEDVDVHFTGEAGLEQRTGPSAWDVTCRGPCDITLTTKGLYRAVDPDSGNTIGEPFQVSRAPDRAPVDLHVEPGSAGERATGTALMLTGGIIATALTIGGIALIASAKPPCTGDHCNDWGGSGPAIGGVLLGGAAIGALLAVIGYAVRKNGEPKVAVLTHF